MYGEAVYDRAERLYEELQHANDRCPSLERGRRLHALLLDQNLDQKLGQNSAYVTEFSARERCHMLKRTRSLDSGKFAKAAAVKLAFKDNLCLV
jgi:hypothetical protein